MLLFFINFLPKDINLCLNHILSFDCYRVRQLLTPLTPPARSGIPRKAGSSR